ncbi:NAD-dependent epimerase/dehydratase family protein [Solicola sp. PLA-1-18]|uniref:NAD-dependent epimerase/dehydratase family protein n=1 Tax=Solicola sp. PLA-1-18 TaxID=3380532 RepID=UPI003B7ADC16
MSDRHVVVGAGPVGREVATQLAASGREVVVLTRSGRDTGIAGVSHEAVDASDPVALRERVEGAVALYNAANPVDYTTWEQLWPPLAASLHQVAEQTGAVLAITGNLYPYGPVDRPMVEGMPDAATDHKAVLRSRMWADALAAHRAGRMHAFEVRGSDYVGTGVGTNGHVSRVLPAALQGKDVRVLGDPDQPHSFTDVRDVARTLVAVVDRPEAWGRVWHVPTNPPRTQTEAVNDVLAAVGKPAVRVRAIPRPITWAAGKVVPMMRELEELRYQWTRPYVLDSSAAQAELGLAPTPWDEVCRRTAVQP